MRCFLKELNYIEIGQKIKKARISMGLSQEAAAELCGLSPSFYSNIERGVKKLQFQVEHLK